MNIKSKNTHPLEPSEIEDADFFSFLAFFETETERFARFGDPAQTPLRLSQGARLGFAANDIHNISYTTRGPARLEVNLFGLLGPEGPMPLNLTGMIRQRQSNKWYQSGSNDGTTDTAFLDLINLLQDRLIAFFWRSWADHRPEIELRFDNGGKALGLVRALSGLEPDRQDSLGAGELERCLLPHAAELARRVRTPRVLESIASEVFEVPAHVREFEASWIHLPDTLQTQIGRPGTLLGRSAPLGRRIFSRQSRITLFLGPMSIENYNAWHAKDSNLFRLSEIVRHVIDPAIEVDLCLVLARDEVPEARLGSAVLGRQAWMGKPKRPKCSDLCFRNIGAAPQQKEVE